MKTSIRRTLPGWALAVTPIAVLYAVIQWSTSHTIWYAISALILRLGVVALMGVGVYRITARLPRPQLERSGAFALKLAMLGVAYTLVQSSVVTIPVLITERGVAAFPWNDPNALFLTDLIWSVTFFIGTASVCYALRSTEDARTREILALRTEASAASARLAALAAQLNPHFVFNTLHGIGALLPHEPETAESAIARFGDLLRYTLDQRQDVTVREELAFVDSYLEVKTMRLGDRLRVIKQIEETTLDLTVPRLILQPLVENAVVHGATPLVQGATVTIRLQRSQTDLVVVVEDDGPGRQPEFVTELPGVGLRALQARLSSLRQPGSLTVTTSVGHGWRTSITLPIPSETLAV